jgi:hypothetical protein
MIVVAIKQVVEKASYERILMLRIVRKCRRERILMFCIPQLLLLFIIRENKNVENKCSPGYGKQTICDSRDDLYQHYDS